MGQELGDEGRMLTVLLLQEFVAKKKKINKLIIITTITIDNQYFMRQAHILMTRISVYIMLYKVRLCMSGFLD